MLLNHSRVHLLHLFVDFSQGLTGGLALSLLFNEALRCFNGVGLCLDNEIFLELDHISSSGDLLSSFLIVVEPVSDLESLKIECPSFIVFLRQAGIVRL